MIFGINKLHFIIILGLFLFIHLSAFLVYGIRSLHDGDRYIAAAEILIKEGRLVQDYRFFYSLHVILISAFVGIFSDPTLPFIIFQIVIYSVGLIAIYKATSLIFGDLSGLITCCILLLWWDNIHWNTTTMTECLFSSTMFFLLFSLARYTGQVRQLMTILVFVAIALLIRPTGVLAAFAVVIFFLSFYWNQLKTKPLILGTFLFGLSILVSVCAVLLFGIWDFTEQLIKGNIVTYADEVESRFLTHTLKVLPARTDIFSSSNTSVERFFIFIYHNPLEFLKAGVLKFTLLVTGFRPYYSVWHNVYALGWVLLIYCAAWTGLKHSLRLPIIAFVLSLVVSNCFLIGISSVDWDNRFYIPMEAGIVMIASNGISKWIARWISS
jgi:hypothetical protein